MPSYKELYSGQYLKAEDVKEKPFVGTIARHESVEMNDGKEKVVIYFEGRKRGMVLNGTRYDTLVEIAKSHEADDWIGIPLSVYASTTKFGGKKTDCIAISSGKKKSAAQKAADIREVLEGDDLPDIMKKPDEAEDDDDI